MLTHTTSESSFIFEQRYLTSVCDVEEVVWLPMLSLPSDDKIQCEVNRKSCVGIIDFCLDSGGSDTFSVLLPIYFYLFLINEKI